jgi:hypothetical protein
LAASSALRHCAAALKDEKAEAGPAGFGFFVLRRVLTVC